MMCLLTYQALGGRFSYSDRGVGGLPRRWWFVSVCARDGSVRLIRSCGGGIERTTTSHHNKRLVAAVGAGVVDGQAATPIFIVGVFVVILYLLERVIRGGRRSHAAEGE